MIQNSNKFQVAIKTSLPVVVPARLFSDGVTRCNLAELSKNFVKTPQLQCQIEFEPLTMATNAKVLQATSPIPDVTNTSSSRIGPTKKNVDIVHWLCLVGSFQVCWLPIDMLAQKSLQGRIAIGI